MDSMYERQQYSLIYMIHLDINGHICWTTTFKMSYMQDLQLLGIYDFSRASFDIYVFFQNCLTYMSKTIFCEGIYVRLPLFDEIRRETLGTMEVLSMSYMRNGPVQVDTPLSYGRKHPQLWPGTFTVWVSLRKKIQQVTYSRQLTAGSLLAGPNPNFF